MKFSTTCLTACLVLAFVERSHGSTETFDNDPGWTTVNLPSDGNDFGYRNSNFAGGNAGEIGGFVSQTDEISWYGDDTIQPLTGDDAISASGLLNIRSVENGFNHNILIGHFDNDAFLPPEPSQFNAIGLQVLENNNSPPYSFRIVYAAGTGAAELFVVTGVDESRTWSYDYDPYDGSFGSLTISVSGAGGTTATHFLTSAERNSIGDLDTFGLAAKAERFAAAPRMQFYVDNSIYTVPEPSTFVLAALGLLSLLAYTWRRRRRG